MKVRPILLLLLLAGSIMVVGWLYYAVTRPALRMQETTSSEVIAELMSCCREKHSHAARYEHFARTAEEEQQAGSAILFRALALSERVQERQVADAIVKLGGEYQPPKRIVLFRGTTPDNLHQSLRHKRRSNDSTHHARIARQLRRGNRLAARVLIWSAAADRRQAALIASHLDTPHEREGYLVCPLCGNLYTESAADPYCPHCLTDSHRFVRVRGVATP